MSEQRPPPEDQMMQWITSRWIAKPISVIPELGIADLLRDGPASVNSLAEGTHAHAPTLNQILRALSSVGIFIEAVEKMFGLTPLAQCLPSDSLQRQDCSGCSAHGEMIQINKSIPVPCRHWICRLLTRSIFLGYSERIFATPCD